MNKTTISGTTPLSPDETAGLKLTHISTQAELNRFEQDNIASALDWVQKRKPKDILNELFIKLLHKKMFALVWKWAGSFRKGDQNLGISWSGIPVEIRKLCDDTSYQIEHKSYETDEIAVRFHHRLVQIHPFPNGNGRHSRLLTDIMLEYVFQRPIFTWCGAELRKADNPRKQYIAALKAADSGDIGPLLLFVRS
ncbi:cell filamentation protein Fic [Candidatus Wirthbacteria bacterium CG2_30_54_11]|uniref:Cell filamentation protein Fic n=1 Tax=Candidatus Wirthbacteria bacterium CG2_30_54_11 TaxID=1817892 RepID=A0A1J5IH32_9BACT|nr:MAG: cell filamentation protein Fic [Candidatus Wirthbacteria bacterium CG2_30_54_11]